MKKFILALISLFSFCTANSKASFDGAAFFKRPDIQKIETRQEGGHHGSLVSYFEQTSDSLELLPGLTYYKGTIYSTFEENQTFIQTINAINGFRMHDAEFLQAGDPHEQSYSEPLKYPSVGVSKADQSVSFDNSSDAPKKIKISKGTLVYFNKRVILAADTIVDSGNTDTLRNHQNIKAKAHTELEFEILDYSKLLPSKLTLAEPYHFGNLYVPKDSEVHFHNGALSRVRNPKAWTVQGVSIPKSTVIFPRATQAYEVKVK